MSGSFGAFSLSIVMLLTLILQAHIGTQNCTNLMEPYIFKRNREGVHIINISKTWEKFMVAARIIAAIKNPKDVVVSSFMMNEAEFNVLNSLGYLRKRLRSESYPEVRHHHWRELHWRQVGPRIPYQSDHQEVRFALIVSY